MPRSRLAYGMDEALQAVDMAMKLVMFNNTVALSGADVAPDCGTADGPQPDNQKHNTPSTAEVFIGRFPWWEKTGKDKLWQ